MTRPQAGATRERAAGPGASAHRSGAAVHCAALVLLLVVGASAAAVAAPSDAEVDAIARELRCVVCQNLSVADSPSEMARQMRDLVREQLARGESPESIKAYFVGRYGEWVLLAPPVRGFSLLAWLLPFLALGGGLAGALVVLWRWSRRGSGAGAPAEDDVDPRALAEVREELRRRAG